MFLTRPLRWILVAGVLTLASSAMPAQPRGLKIAAPPPMRFIPRAERAQLENARDPKTRIRTAIDLALGHLTQTDELTKQRKFESALEELGNYLGLIDDMRQFLSSLDRSKNSTRDLYRHLDIALRGDVLRLEVIRRSTSVEYAGNFKVAEDYARNARSEALEAFYGHSVLREDNKTKNPPPENKLP